LTVESRSRDGGNSAGNFSVNLSVPIQCETNQCIGYYLKEAHLPLNSWTVNKDYDSFQLSFPYSEDLKIYDVQLKHGIYEAAQFASMVQNALNLVKYNVSTGDYDQHKHAWADHASDSALKTAVNAEITAYNADTDLVLKKRGGASVTNVALISETGDLNSYISFSVQYNSSNNRFSIARTDVGRLYESGQFDIAIEHYQLAKAFGCPWGHTFSTTTVVKESSQPTYYKDISGKDQRFYVPRSGTSYDGFIYDDSGTWLGNSQGKTFKRKHKNYILSSEKWKGSAVSQKGINVMKSSNNGVLSGDDSSESAFPVLHETGAYVNSDKVPQRNWFEQTLLMPYSSRIRGDDCYYIRSSLFGSESLQTNHGGGGSNCLQMVKIDKALSEVMFWTPA
jgi:hypothetical protein